jgi:hypothetical protein
MIEPFVKAIMSSKDDSAETQKFFDGVSVSVAATKALLTGKKERIKYI